MFALVLALAAAAPDTAAFADAATEALVSRAVARRRAEDARLLDYRARLRYRLSFALGQGRWSRPPVLALEEQEGVVQWARPNDLRVDIAGRRTAQADARVQLSSDFDEPWFVPTGVGDSVRIVSREFPAVGALHPLAATGPAWYRYRIEDSVRVTVPPGRALTAYAVAFTPVRVGPALLVGRVWLTGDDAAVVRLTFRYVGTGLFERPRGATRRDSLSALRTNRVANQLLSVSADLEYQLEEGALWLPRRQALSGELTVAALGDLVVRFEAITALRDYAVNTGDPVPFGLPAPDTTAGATATARRGRTPGRGGERTGYWSGGRWEIHRPTDDSLSRYGAWDEPLSVSATERELGALRATVARLQAMAEDLDPELTGRTRFGTDLERITDLVSYNRAHGWAFGVGVRARLPARFTDLYLTGRYGTADERLYGRAAIVRDGPGWKLTLAGYRDLADQDPVSRGRTYANSLNALFAARDNADYHLATGASARLDLPVGTGVVASLQGGWERQRSVAPAASSSVNRFFGGPGDMGPIAPVLAGDAAVGAVRLARPTGPVRWSLNADGLAVGDRLGARLWGEVAPAAGATRGATLRLKGGVSAVDEGPDIPQLLYRVGGQHTVRGFDYGLARGSAFWSAQLDVAPLPWALRPVAFLDAGRAGRPADLARGEVLVGAGVGLALYASRLQSGIIRFDVSRPVSQAGGWRLDLVVQGVR